MATTTAAWPLTDRGLAQRLERAEGAANAACIETRARLDPASGASWTAVAGVYAMFDGATSPLTQTFGLGLFDPVGDAEFEQLERFYEERGAPVFHEVSTLISQEILGHLNRRGYQPMEFSTVLVRPTVMERVPGSTVSARRIEAGEDGLWARVAAEGWSSESPELAAFIEDMGRVLANAHGYSCFLAEREGRPIAAAALSISGDVALLAGASTIPAARRQGGQRALLEERLRFAAAHGAQLAMMVAQPGSGSQRNAERQGFRTAYTRVKWQRGASG